MAFLFPLLHKSSNSFFGHNYSLLGLYPFMIFYYLQSMHNCKKWGKVPITISIHYLLLNYTILYLEYPGNDKKGHSKPTFFMFNSRKVIPLCHIFSLQMCSVWSSTGCTEYIEAAWYAQFTCLDTRTSGTVSPSYWPLWSPGTGECTQSHINHIWKRIFIKGWKIQTIHPNDFILLTRQARQTPIHKWLTIKWEMYTLRYV